ncbi:MAG: hypothetical protein GF417_12495 [Candidatus Latescibacteria bacterium]|nr:hypothetical protein [bacterium]MBD3425248.1 hypothetical protein [Candidatus Latescibacterota bacterium]
MKEMPNNSRINKLEEAIREHTAGMEKAPSYLDPNLLTDRIRKRADLLNQLFRVSDNRERLAEFLREIRSRDAVTMARLKIRYDEVKDQLSEINSNSRVRAAYRSGTVEAG